MSLPKPEEIESKLLLFKSKVMGLDLSARNTGICVIDSKNKEIIFEHISTFFTPSESNFRITFIWLYVFNIIKKFNIKNVCIEDYSFNKFQGSRSTTVLGEINGGVKNIASFDTSITFSTTSPTHAVKNLLGSLKKMQRDEKKKIVLQYVVKLLLYLKEHGWTITLYNNNLLDDDTDAFALAYNCLLGNE